MILGQVLQEANEQKGITNDININPIASTLANFLGGSMTNDSINDNNNILMNDEYKITDGGPDSNTPNNNDTHKKERKKRGSTDLTELSQKVSKLENKIKKLENTIIDKDKKYKNLELQNIELLKQIKYLEYSKAELSILCNNEINKLREYLKIYHKYYMQNSHK